MVVIANFIYGFGIGLEFVPDYEENGDDAWILDLVILRLVWFKAE